MSRRAWPLTLSAREGVATARAGRWTSVLIVAAVAWLTGAPGAADALDATRLVEAERDWIDDGAYVFVVSGFRGEGAQNPVPVGACERLAQADGVAASFAASHAETPVGLSHAPGGRITLVDVTPGAATFLGAAADANGLALVAEGLAERAGMVDGEPVVLTGATGGAGASGSSGVLRARIVSARQLGTEYEGVVLVPTLMGEGADSCFVRTDAAHVAAVETLLPAALAWDAKPAMAAPLLFTGEHTVDYAGAFEERSLRWAWVATGALLALLWAMIQWFRRSQVAIYATFGMQAASRLVMQVGEWGVQALVGAAWGWSLGIVGAVAFGARAEQALAQVSWHALLTLMVATVLVVLLGLRPTGTLLNQLKDR